MNKKYKKLRDQYMEAEVSHNHGTIADFSSTWV